MEATAGGSDISLPSDSEGKNGKNGEEGKV